MVPGLHLVHGSASSCHRLSSEERYSTASPGMSTPVAGTLFLNSVVLLTSWQTRPSSDSMRSTPTKLPSTAFAAFTEMSSISLVILHASALPPLAVFVRQSPSE